MVSVLFIISTYKANIFWTGLFGNRGEVTSQELNELAQINNWVLIATDWAGMSNFDLLTTARAFILNGSDLKMLPERLMQAFVNKAITLKLVREIISQSSEMVDIVNKKPIISPLTSFSYYGISQ